MNNKNDCLLCGKELVYFDTPRRMVCAICHREFENNVACEDGHYICDECHAKNGVLIIQEACAHTESRDPIGIMTRLMREPFIHMHGPEHHVLVGSALLAAYHNSGGGVDLAKALPEMARRGMQVPGGACGFWGCCGAAVSAGMFISIVTGSTPLKNNEWGLSNLMTAAALERIGKVGGPRCCKRDSFLAVQTAVAFTQEHLGIKMELPAKIACGFSPLNAQCIGGRCPFHQP